MEHRDNLVQKFIDNMNEKRYGYMGRKAIREYQSKIIETNNYYRPDKDKEKEKQLKLKL